MVTDYMLNYLATVFKNKVAKVVINGGVEITEIVTTEVSNETYILEFDTPDNLQRVNHLQLFDIDGNVLLDARLFMPIETNVRIKCELSFKNMNLEVEM